jgi:glycosyltransferase involved in cell wall biosynthesis
MSKPKISVVMPVLNCQRFVSESIASILNQSFEDFELIVIDGGSVDETAHIVSSFTDDRIIFKKTEEKKPLVESLNEGIKLSRAALIARQDADDISHSNRLSHQYECFSANQDLSVLGTSYWCIAENGPRLYKVMAKPELILTDFETTNPICHGSVMFRKSVVCAENAYDPLFRGAEDYELWCRIASRGYKMHNNLNPLYSLRFHGSRVSEKANRDQLLKHCLVEELYFGNLKRNLLDQLNTNDENIIYGLLSQKRRLEYHTHLIKAYMKSKKYTKELSEFVSLSLLDFNEAQKLFRGILLERTRSSLNS